MIWLALLWAFVSGADFIAFVGAGKPLYLVLGIAFGVGSIVIGTILNREGGQ